MCYKHKRLVPKELSNFSDRDFKLQVVLSFKREFFSSYDMVLFYKHIRNINMCVSRIVKNGRSSSYDSAVNSITFLYGNYLESFVDSILSHYFHQSIKKECEEVLRKIVASAWDKIYK